MTDWRTLAAAGIFGGWAAATFLHGTERFRELIRALDVLTVVPEWRFFGRHPGRVDFHLLYRDSLRGYGLTDWIELPLIVPRPWHAFVFNPARRSAKALMDVVIHLSQELKRGGADAIVGSLPYLTILQHVSAQPATELSTHRQFLLMQTSADSDGAEPELLVASELHALELLDRF
jgi:hypothetical protein